MPIFLNVLFLIVGMVLLIKGADFFVSGASEVAKRLKVPALFIGLTIVSLGTSLPELSVSITSAICGCIDMSVGNIVGSNLFNMLLILGIVAIFNPIQIKPSVKKIDLPFLLAVTGILMIFSFDTILNGLSESIVSRSDGLILLIVLILYMYVLISNAIRFRKQEQENNYNKEIQDYQNQLNEQPKEEKNLKVWQIVLYIVLGLSAVVFGGECVSSTAKYLALAMGMSEALVGLTIVALGTSLPELVTSIVASKKGENDLSLGNVIGSNIVNISLILSSVGIIAQAPISVTIITDIIILFATTVIFIAMCAKRTELTKLHGFILIGLYVAYLTFTIIRNYCF